MINSFLIRAEDKNRWERRAPLVPEDVAEILAETGAKAYVEKSDKRYFPVEAYRKAGAEICDGMQPGDVIFGVKEIPKEKILDGKIYLFFSHTIKGQAANMPMLRKILDSGSTLIDYERITTKDNRRIVYFGRYAGDAGTIDILSLMGEYWSAHGIETPLKEIRRAHEYDSVEAAREHLEQVGRRIRDRGFPEKLAPLAIGVLGYGNVSQGVQQILSCLPCRFVSPDELPACFEETPDRNRLVVSVSREEHLVEHREGGPFDLEEYYRHPERYRSRFYRDLPYFTILINAVYWDSRYPRFVTWEALRRLARENDSPRLCGIADITCDPNGSIECNVRATDSDMPAYQVDPQTGRIRDGHTGEGIVVLAVDNLPCELPADSSRFFSRKLAPLVPGILRADFRRPLVECGLRPEVRKAVIVYRGRLTPDYEYLDRYLQP